MIVPRSGSFEYTLEAPCSAATAVALLGDLRRQGELHPLIVKVKIELTAPTLLFRYALSTAETAHRELGRRIGARLAELPA